MPKLRFKRADGSDYGEYKNETVGSLFTYITRRNTNMECVNVITNSAELGLIPQRDFFDKDIAVEGNTEKYYVIEQGDFVYNPRKSASAPYGPFNCYKRTDEGIVSPLYTCLKPLFPKYTDFLLWYFASPAWHSYIYHNGAQGGARHDRVGMTKDLMDGIPVNIPELEEQEKISKFLSLIEHRLELQHKLVNALKSYKRGVLSRLFPKNGSRVPEYRFSGFAGDWKQHKLGEVGITYSGLSGKSKDDFGHGKGRFVTYMNVFLNAIADIKKTEAVEIDKRQNEVQFGDVFFTTSSETPEEVGMSSVWLGNAENIYLNSFCFGYRPNAKIDSYYMAYMLRSDALRKKIIFLAQGISRYNISKNKVMEIEIPLPNLKEQKQIGSFFHSLDNLITIHQLKLDEYKTIKQGLLEKLFI